MFVRSILTVLALVVTADVAGATTLATAPLPGATTYKCMAVNLGKTREIDLQIRAQNSGGVQSISCMGVEPLHTCAADANLGQASLGLYCVVTFKGSKKTVRASLTALNGGLPVASVPAE